jgi:Fe-S-cluster containining protein
MLGKCCDNFSLDVSPEELEIAYRGAIDGECKKNLSMHHGKRSGTLDNHYRTFEDILLIYPMVRFLYADNVHSNGNIKTEDKVWYHYKCIHHNLATGFCDIYAIRPKMCISFPDGNPCMYDNCKCAKDLRNRPYPPTPMPMPLAKKDTFVAGSPERKECKADKPVCILCHQVIEPSIPQEHQKCYAEGCYEDQYNSIQGVNHERS